MAMSQCCSDSAKGEVITAKKTDYHRHRQVTMAGQVTNEDVNIKRREEKEEEEEEGLRLTWQYSHR